MQYEPLLNRTYFEGELNIGQVDQQQVEDELLQFIRKHEYDFVVKLLGLPLYEALYAALDQPTPPARFQSMAYGKFFFIDQVKVKTGTYCDALGRIHTFPRQRYFDKMPVNYRGLLKRVNSDTNLELLNDGYGASSPIAKYVYRHWMIAHATSSGGAGENIQQTHNGVVVSNSYKIEEVWNEMCTEVENFYFFLDMNIADYPEFNLPDDGRFHPRPINRFNLL
jgi:hypothetical protein